MKISVIVPVYNVERYIKECLYSALSQTYRDFELIIIDDGSTDNSGVICERFKKVYPDLIDVIHQKNQGVFSARITGINRASGDILVFLDSDDTLHLNALELIVSSFVNHNCDLLLFDAGNSEIFESKRVKNFLVDDLLYDSKSKNILYEKLLNGEIPNSICLKAIKREKGLLSTELNAFCTVKYGEDLIMSAYFINKCERILYLKEELYCYRNRPGSAVNSFNIHRSESIKIVHTEIEKQIEELGLLNLKPLHNSRKVKGWIECLILLLKNIKTIGKQEFFCQIKGMAEDSYFIKAYQDMECNSLSVKYRIIAFCLYKKQYFLLYLMSKIIQCKNFK